VLGRLAEGLSAAGATGSVGGHLPLVEEYRLSGEGIEELLFGQEIEGRDFWLSQSSWQQHRDPEGRVVHDGYALHAGLRSPARGIGRTEGDSLCDRWSSPDPPVEICVAVFRVPPGAGRLRWGDYIMVTDIGPAPFRVVDR